MYVGAPYHESQQVCTESAPVNNAVHLDDTDGVDITEMLDATLHCPAERATSNGEYLVHDIDTLKEVITTPSCNTQTGELFRRRPKQLLHPELRLATLEVVALLVPN
jgi:hypothetical protein